MHLRIARPTPIPPDRLYAWWTDFRDGTDDHAFLARRHRHLPRFGRKVLHRKDGRLEIEDVGRFLVLPLVEHYTVHLHPERHAVALHGANNLARFSAEYRFEDGQAVVESHVAPLGLVALVDALVQPVVARFLGEDLEGHLEDAAHDLGFAGPGLAQAQGQGVG